MWGGRRLQSLLHKPLPESGNYGESWDISPLPQAISRVADGPAAGLTIDELWRGGLAEQAGLPVERGFPWLIKWLDVADQLSVQVHPDEAHAVKWLGEPCAKSEAWVVVHAEPTARVYAGFQSGVTEADVRRALAHGRLAECLHSFAPKAGDFINLPAGTVHAAGGGLVLAEVQQPSDVTFRLFDWNRIGPDGKPRTLHIEQALDCLTWPQGPVNAMADRRLIAEPLVTAPHFRLDRMRIMTPWTAHSARMVAWMVLDGAAVVEWGHGERPLRQGATVLIPAGIDGIPRNPTTGIEGIAWRSATHEPVTLLRIGRPGSRDAETQG